MDAITKQVLEILALRHPGCAIHMSHQFLDGSEGRECGFVPNNWDGELVAVNGRWWDDN